MSQKLFTFQGSHYQTNDQSMDLKKIIPKRNWNFYVILLKTQILNLWEMWMKKVSVSKFYKVAHTESKVNTMYIKEQKRKREIEENN